MCADVIVVALIDANSIPGSFPGDANTTDPEGKIRQPHHPREATGGFLIIGVKPEADAAVATFDYYDERGERLYHHEKRRGR